MLYGLVRDLLVLGRRRINSCAALSHGSSHLLAQASTSHGGGRRSTSTVRVLRNKLKFSLDLLMWAARHLRSYLAPLYKDLHSNRDAEAHPPFAMAAFPGRSAIVFRQPQAQWIRIADPRRNTPKRRKLQRHRLAGSMLRTRSRYMARAAEQGTGGGGLNPGSTQVRTLGLDQRGGRPNINIKNLGSTQVQPRFNPGSTQVKPSLNPRSTQVQPRFSDPGSTQVL